MPKKGAVFNRVMDHLIKLKIPDEAEKYKRLSMTVIQHQLAVFAGGLQ